MHSEEGVNRCTYLLPIRRARYDAAEVADLAGYLHSLGEAGCEVLVVDGSSAEVWAQHDFVWSGVSRHATVDRSFGYMNDKVNGIHTGVQLAKQEKIILADDDIRYTASEIEQTCALLESFEVVRPQNFLSPRPWWAKMEAARMLINRASLRTGDYPGTCAFRRETMLRVGHYDGDVLFDNEEIIRHFASEGARVAYEIDLFFQKRPPALRKWIE
ncbi:MAG: glycosyltransferase family 2 protein, partial [Verrucomicrobiota bacterium]|nr:glycosyltransferase family 2 protein [Verrucomicrobiota bacterium]